MGSVARQMSRAGARQVQKRREIRLSATGRPDEKVRLWVVRNFGKWDSASADDLRTEYLKGRAATLALEFAPVGDAN
jgi:hypothetical protein